MDIYERLFSVQDIRYRDFQLNLTPGLTEEYMIGVRTPELRKIAKELINPIYSLRNFLTNTLKKIRFMYLFFQR